MKKQKKENNEKNRNSYNNTTPTTTDLYLQMREISEQIDLMIKYHKESNSGNEGFAEGLNYAKNLIKDKFG